MTPGKRRGKLRRKASVLLGPPPGTVPSGAVFPGDGGLQLGRGPPTPFVTRPVRVNGVWFAVT